MYEIIISDDTLTWTMPELEVPLTMATAKKSTDVEALSNNIYTDTFPSKRTGSHTWAYMSKDNYDILYGFWYRQDNVLFKYPRITITELNIVDMVARIDVGAQNIIDHCGEVQGASLSFRESKQNPGSS